MKVTPIKTKLIRAGDDLQEILRESLPPLQERSIVVIASKIFSTVENRFVPKTTTDPQEKYDLVRKEAEWYMEPNQSKYGTMLTVKRNWMFAYAGIDESNADNHYLLWPSDPQRSVNQVWQFIRQHYGLKEVGVTMSDSASLPLNWGVTGHAIAYCGFKPLRSYIGKPDLFGRPMRMEQLNVMQSVTAAATLEMGEGAEQTPIGLVEDLSSIEFQDHVPTAAELKALHIELEDDVFAPLLVKAAWKKGQPESLSMAKINITTKTGDTGESGLANGQRLGKEFPVFEVIGTVDEVNSWLGLVAAKLNTAFEVHKQHLYEIQDTLFYIGAEVAHSPKARLTASAVTQLEDWSKELHHELEDNWHTKFVLPGGTELGGYLDVARTVARRGERLVIAYHRQQPVSPAIIQYLNRLSDYLYLLRCFVNQQEQYQEKQFEADKTKHRSKVKPKVSS